MPHDIHDVGENAAIHDPDRSDALTTNLPDSEALHEFARRISETRTWRELCAKQQAETEHWYEKARDRLNELHNLRLAYTGQRFDVYRLLMALAASLVVNVMFAWRLWGQP